MRPEHLFLSSDGDLFDTRITHWHRKAPLRKGFAAGVTTIETCAHLKACLRHGPYAWPGGYPLYFLCSDGGVLSFAAVRAELRNVLDSIHRDIRDGWRVVGCEINYEDSNLVCEHTGEKIPSAYAD